MVAHLCSTIVLVGIVALASAQNFANTGVCQPVFDNNGQNDGAAGFVRFDVSAGVDGFSVNDLEFVADLSGTYNVSSLYISDGSIFSVPAAPRTALVDANSKLSIETQSGGAFRLGLPSSFEVAPNSIVGVQVNFENRLQSSNPPLCRYSEVGNTNLPIDPTPSINGDTARQWGSLMVSVGQAFNVDLVDNVVFHGGVCVTNLEQTLMAATLNMTSEEVVAPTGELATVLNAGEATATIIFDQSSYVISFRVDFVGLSSDPISIGLYNPALRGEVINQDPQFQINDLQDVGTTGFVDSTDQIADLGTEFYRLNPSQRDSLFAGMWYVQIDTEDNVDGELRAQIENFVESTTTVSFPLTVDAVEVGLDGDFMETLSLTQRAELVAGSTIGLLVPDAQATAIITFESGSDIDADNAVVFDIQFSGLSGDVTAAHFHRAALNTGNSGAQLITLDVFIDNDENNPGEGTIVGQQNRLVNDPDATPLEIQSALDGLWYLNLHTAANPAGEVRAQVNRGQATVIASSGSGFATVTLDQADGSVRLQVEYEGLSSAITGVEIRGPVQDDIPERDTSLLMVVATSSISLRGDGSSGIASGVGTPSAADFSALTGGRFYVIVLTEANPISGELRGTVVAQNIPEIETLEPQSFSAAEFPLSVEAEINALDENLDTAPLGVPDSLLNSNATGMALVSYDASSGVISWDIEFNNLAGVGELTAAHFHGPAGPTSTAPVRVDLVANSEDIIDGNTLRGGVIISDTLAREALAGLWYVNLHGTDNPMTGELRGQIMPIVVNVDLPVEQVQVVTALQTQPIPLTRAATIASGLTVEGGDDIDGGIGSAVVTLYPNNTLSWEIGYTAPLSSDVTLIHFHGPAIATETAGVRVTVFGGAPDVNMNPNIGSVELPDPAEVLRDELEAGLWYINIHTELNPMGELRGQVVGLENVAVDLSPEAVVVATTPAVDIEDNGSSTNSISLSLLISSVVATFISVC